MASEIRRLQGITGAAAATGVAVIIDVFRAFTTACVAAAAGARPIIPLADPDQIVGLLVRYLDAITAGERFGKPLPGCDFGNSPAHLATAHARLAGRPFLHATHAGTRGLLAAMSADHVFAASLVNAAATAEAVRLLRPPCVCLVAMGWTGDTPADEDDACADYLEALLRGNPYDTSQLTTRLSRADAAAKFFDPAMDWAPEDDFHHCLDVDAYPFALRLNRRLTPPVLEPLRIN